jgi:hypothetical protein
MAKAIVDEIRKCKQKKGREIIQRTTETLIVTKRAIQQSIEK